MVYRAIFLTRRQLGLASDDRDNEPVTITVKAVRGEVAICVGDEGPGIPDDELDLVFRRCYRTRGLARAMVRASASTSRR